MSTLDMSTIEDLLGELMDAMEDHERNVLHSERDEYTDEDRERALVRRWRFRELESMLASAPVLLDALQETYRVLTKAHVRLAAAGEQPAVADDLEYVAQTVLDALQSAGSGVVGPGTRHSPCQARQTS